MQIIWLGHGSFRLEVEDQVLLIDPWLTGNPMLPVDQHDAAVAGATDIFVTHAHDDHIADVPDLSQRLQIPVSGPYELAQHLQRQGAVAGDAFNMGGTVSRGSVKISMVPASHSNATQGASSQYMGTEAGYVIQGEGHVIYVSGDTGIMADMDWIGDFYKPDIGILSAGGYFTMGMTEAGYAARRYFKFDTIIPCHYRTFPLLEQDASALAKAVPDAKVIEPDVMQPIVI